MVSGQHCLQLSFQVLPIIQLHLFISGSYSQPPTEVLVGYGPYLPRVIDAALRRSQSYLVTNMNDNSSFMLSPSAARMQGV